MAAGKGERLQPITNEIPKPLIKIKGIRMIDSIIDGLRFYGVNEIIVVIGHLKEQFYDWAHNQNDIRLIENPHFDRCNNISSMYVARDYLEDCFVIDGDQIIYNREILEPHFLLSGYNAVWCEGKTKEWLMNVDAGLIKSCSRTGGTNGWQLFSISRWTKEDGHKLRKHIELEFEAGNNQLYWDDVVMFKHFDEYNLGIREMQYSDLAEIDSLEELTSLDSKYCGFSKQIDLLCIKDMNNE